MAESELAFKRISAPILSPETQTINRLVFAHRGRTRFQQSMDGIATMPAEDADYNYVWLAKDMTDANLPADQIVDKLAKLKYKKGWTQKAHQHGNAIHIAQVHGMMGNIDVLDDVTPPIEEDGHLWEVTPFIYAGHALIRQGKNPEAVLAEATRRVDTANLKPTDYSSRAERYGEIALAMHAAGLDPKPVFDKAEESIEIGKKQPRQIAFDSRVYEEHSEKLAQAGLREDAMRMLDNLGIRADRLSQFYKPSWISMILLNRLEGVTKGLLANGDIEGALLVAARGLKGNQHNLYATVLAEKAVHDASTGVNPDNTVDEVYKTIAESKYPQSSTIFEKVLPNVGVALEKSGKPEEAQKVFGSVKASLDQTDLLNASDIGFGLARALNTAGYDPADLYRHSFDLADQFRKEEEIDELWWSMRDKGITTVVETGHLDLAREYVEAPNGSIGNRTLAYAEVKAGLTEAEIGTLPVDLIRNALSSDRQDIIKAAQYFNLPFRLHQS